MLQKAKRRLPSLRTEVLLTFGVLAASALFIAIVSVVLFFSGLTDAQYGGVYLTLLVLADVAIFVLFGAHQLRRHFVLPLDAVVAATEAISTGDLTRRAPTGATAEFAALARSVNRMTDRLIGDQLQLVRAEKLASVGRLAAGVAHEIGNPLGAIAGYLHLLRRAGNDPQTVDAVDAIEREASRVDRIVRGLLDYARPRRVTPTPVDVNETIEGAVRLLADQGVLRRVSVKLGLEPSPPVLFGERHDLEQALVNLFLNAVDAMKGEGTIAVIVRRYLRDEITEAPRRRANDPEFTVKWRPPDPRVLAWLNATNRPAEIVKVIVADSGPGVPSEISERVFDPFFTTKEPGKGTGLGLAIVARIVESFAGAVWVEPAREGGAAFHMVFPLATLPVGRSALAPPAAAGATA